MTSRIHTQQTRELSSSRLRNKVAVVTGAAKGIGRAAAVAFAGDGADIIGIDINAPVDPRSGVTPATLKDFNALTFSSGAIDAISFSTKPRHEKCRRAGPGWVQPHS